MHTIGVAVAGTGFIGPVHVEALKRLGVRITGILGSRPEKSEVARQRLGLPRAYARFDDILADDEVQAVHLAVPNVLHFDMARRALLAGKHVMCEKPLAMNADESAKLVALAAQTGLQAGVCYNIRFYPLNLEARDRIRRGEVGTVFSVVGRYVQDWLLYDTDYNWRVLADQGGALRAVSDIGTHWMDLVCSITGLGVEAVFADLKTVHPVRYEIAGSRCALAWNSEQPNELWIGHRDRPNAVLMRDPALVADLARGSINYPGGHNEGFPDTFKQCFRAFYDAIDSGASPADALYPTFEEGHREILLCDAILQSHREERWVRLSNSE